MTDTDRFDVTLDRDWDRFASQLEGRFMSLAEADTLELSTETAAGHTTCVRARTNPAGRITVEVVGADAVTRPLRDAAPLTRHVVSLLRMHVPHPAFLRSHPPIAATGLRGDVSDTLTRKLGRPVPVDADGDFVVIIDSHVVFVVVDGDGRSIRLWAPLLHDIPEFDAARPGVRAAEALAELNKGWPHIKVVLVEDRLVATVDLLGDPFVPRHLTELLDRLRVFLGTVDAGFARRFDGVRYGFEPGFDARAGSGSDTEGTVFDEPT